MNLLSRIEAALRAAAIGDLSQDAAVDVLSEVKDHLLSQAEVEAARLKTAVGSLSYSELNGVSVVMSALDGSEGLLVAAKLADAAGITRSMITGALRKLESAGIITTRSLGMKGTQIKLTGYTSREIAEAADKAMRRVA